MKDIIFRCNVSPKTGTGHVRRCLVLAEEIQKMGGEAFFILKSKEIDLPTILLPVVNKWTVLPWNISPEDELQTLVQIFNNRKSTALVVDHYEADSSYQEHLFNAGINWLQFDGCSGKPLWADWILNPSLAFQTCEYDGILKRNDTQLLLGPEYALLRSEFSEFRKKIRFSNKSRKILITMGGGDDRGATLFCLKALTAIENRYEYVVLTTSNNPRIPKISKWIDDNHLNVMLVVDESQIAKRMVEADIGIIAGGMTTFETAAMGLPSLIIQIAGNQALNAAAWESAGVAMNLGRFDQLSKDTLCDKVMQLIANHSKRQQMHTLGMNCVDCRGGERVAELMLD